MHIHVHKKRINWWSSATYPHTPSAWKVCFIPPKLEGAQPKEPEGSASYYLCFWCVLFSMGFGCVQQRRRSDTRRWQSSPTARPRSPSLPGTQAEGFFCEPKEIELQREDLEFSLEVGHTRSWEGGEGQCHSVYKSCISLLGGGGCCLLAYAVCIQCCLYTLVRLNFFFGVIIALQWIKTLGELLFPAFVSIQAKFLFVAMSEH